MKNASDMIKDLPDCSGFVDGTVLGSPPLAGSVDNETNLCADCLLDFGACVSSPVFGASDNVVERERHIAKPKGWKCGCCGYNGPQNVRYDTFCSKCRRHK
jgi:hypothetical protein